MGAFSNTAANAYASQIKAVYEHLSEIKKVAQRLTPVEDLETFQAQIEDIHTKLDLLVETSELIVTATPTGEAILTGTIASIQALLEIGKLPDDLVYQHELEGLLTDLQGVLQGGINLVAGEVNSLDIRMNAAENNTVVQQGTITGLQTNYLDMLNGLSTQQSNLTTAISRIEVAENSLTLHDSQLDTISQSITDVENGLSGFNSALSGLTSTVSSIDGRTTINANAIDQLTSELVDLDTGLTGTSSALSLLETTVTGLGNDLVAQSNHTTELESAIGSNGNLLPNADLIGVTGWNVVVAEDTWAGGTLEAGIFITMPAEVNHIGIRGIPSPTGIVTIESPPVLVEQGRHYMVSGYPACNLDRDAELSYKFFDKLGNVVGQGPAPVVINLTSSNDFSAYTRTWVKTSVAPVGVASLRMYLTVESYGTGGNAEAAIVRPMVERVWALQSEPGAWTPNISGVPEALATAVQDLETEVSIIDGQVLAVSNATTALATRVDNAEGALVNEIITSANKDAAHSASINNLNSRMVTAEGDLLTNAGAISSLSTNVSTLGGTVSSHSTSLINLQNQVNALDMDAGGSGAAISALDSRVTIAEGTISSQQTAITNLQAATTNANKVFVQGTAPATAGRTEGDIWIDTANGNKFYTFDSASTTWIARPDNNKNRVFVQGSAPSGAVTNDLWVHTGQSNRMYRWNGTAWVEVSDARIATTASAVTNLETRVLAAEGVNTSQATSITDLQSAITNPSTGLAANASAISSLGTTVSAQGGAISSHASSISSLSTTVGGHTATLTTYGNSINGLQANWGVNINVNGKVSGLKSVNNGTTSTFEVLADAFRVIGSGAEGMEWQNGYLRSWGGSSQAVLGAPFGADNLMLFLGPNVGAGAASKVSAGLWADASGNVGISGTVESSFLKASALSIESTRIATGGGRLAPFTIRDSRYIVQNNTNASRTLVIGDFVSPHYGSGYHYMRFARNKMDVWIDVQISGDTGNETAIVEAQYDGGGWIQIQSVTFNCNYRGSFPIMFRYTTLESWNTLSIRVRTTQNRTEAMRITTDVANYNESGNAAGSNSGTAGGGGVAPPGGGGGGSSWCVDYETTVLPDGRFARELAVGDLVACWDDDPYTPAIIMLPVRAIGFGEEECFELEAGGATIIQSRSTPMTLRDGTTAFTADMLGKDVLVRDKHGHLRWEPVNRVTNVGGRRVVLMNAGDRMYFAGQDPDTTLATHNSTKPYIP